jgi:hypothetical protein
VREQTEGELREHASSVVRIPLCGRGGIVRAWAVVDEEDAATVLEHRWRLDSYGYAIAHVYRNGARRTALMHRVVLDPPASMCVDHRNRDKLDNRTQNLHVVTHAENMMNVGANRGSTSPYRGVSWSDRLGKWVASFRGRHLGCFDSEDEAARCAAHARDGAASRR